MKSSSRFLAVCLCEILHRRPAWRSPARAESLPSISVQLSSSGDGCAVDAEAIQPTQKHRWCSKVPTIMTSPVPFPAKHRNTNAPKSRHPVRGLVQFKHFDAEQNGHLSRRIPRLSAVQAQWLDWNRENHLREMLARWSC